MSGPRTRALRILIVEDHVETADMLLYLLVPGGHECRIAHDPAAAVQAVREFLPDVALIGIGRPSASWVELPRRMRDAATWSFRLIATTGFGSDGDRARAAAADFAALLERPTSVAGLLSELAPGRPPRDE